MSTEDTSAPRREFLARAGLAGLGAGFLPAASLHAAEAASPVHADILITGARVYTMDDAQPEAEAVALAGDRILAVGSNDDVGALAGPGTQLIDGRGTTVLPGFIDAHSHPDGASEVTGADVNLRSIAAIQDAMRKQAGSTPPGHWVIGYKYDDTKLSEGRPVNRHDLDEAVPGQPAIIRHRGGHTAVVNTPGLELAGITADTPDPDGGRFGRDNGELTGFIAEEALAVIEAAGEWPEITRDVRQQGVAYLSRAMAASGLTSTTDAWGQVESLIAYQDARAAGELLTRLSFMPYGPSPLFGQLKAAGIRSGFGDEWIRFGAVKYWADGSASERTMRMSTPFEGRPDDYGILTMSQDEIDAAVDDAVASGWRIGIHANGDVTVDMALNAYERVLRGWQGPNPRLRLEHCSLVNPDLLRRIQVGGLRRREDAVDVRAQVLPGLRDRRGARLGLHPGSFRTADGDPEHGHAQGLPGPRLGPEPAHHRAAGPANLHRQRRLGIDGGSHQGQPGPGQTGRPGHAGRGPARHATGRDQAHPGPPHHGGRKIRLRSLSARAPQPATAVRPVA
jgi:predicted amidohydrolase YtcJ